MTKIELEDDADENTHHYRFDGIGRLTLDTMHGMIIIDVRAQDVNALHFVAGSGKTISCCPPRLSRKIQT